MSFNKIVRAYNRIITLKNLITGKPQFRLVKCQNYKKNHNLINTQNYENYL